MGKIRCDHYAKYESENLDKKFDERLENEKAQDESSIKITYLNVRSFPPHYKDVKQDPTLMKSDVICLGETWLEEGFPDIPLDGFNGTSDIKPKGQGRGKGLSLYTKLQGSVKTFTSVNGNASAILQRSEKLHIICLYLSGNFDWQELREVFDLWICGDKPTVILGDCNWDYQLNHPMKTYLINKGFLQCMTRATHEQGNKIDHLYICPMVQELSYKIVHQSVHFSDQDIIGINIKQNCINYL